MKPNSIFALVCAVALLAAICVLAAGCAHWPATPQLQRVGVPGYLLAEVTCPGQSDDLMVVLATSGGGMRVTLRNARK